MRSLGTLLRNLLEQLDGSVEQIYKENDLSFKPRYFPVAKLLDECGPLSIKALSEKTGVSHSAMSQTVSDMKKTGWLVSVTSEDKRERKIDFSQSARQSLPTLKAIWTATAMAATELNTLLPTPLEETAQMLLDALSRQSFYNRIRENMDK